MADYTNIDQASPALTGLPSMVPSVEVPKAMTWQDILKAVASMSGGSASPSFSGLTQGLGSNVNSGIPLYTPPLQALPMQDEQQKQTSASDIDQYAKIFAQLFGGDSSAGLGYGTAGTAAGLSGSGVI